MASCWWTRMRHLSSSNGADAKAARMFTVAHELAHVFVGASAAFHLREMEPAEDRMERLCNRVAAEFLVPERALREMWPSVQGAVEAFVSIAPRFKGSPLVGARRALDLDLIDEAQFGSFCAAYQAHARRAEGLETSTRHKDIGLGHDSAPPSSRRRGKASFSTPRRTHSWVCTETHSKAMRPSFARSVPRRGG